MTAVLYYLSRIIYILQYGSIEEYCITKCRFEDVIDSSGDIELCPGPNKATCKDCLKTIRRNQRQGECERCNSALHLKCLIDSTENHVENLICSGCVDMPMENVGRNY